MLLGEIFHRIAVAHHITLEPEPRPQHIRQIVMTPRNRHAVVIVVRHHHTQRIRLPDHPFIWPKMNHLRLARRQARIGPRKPFAHPLVVRVDAKMFHRRNNLLTLHAFHHRNGQFGNQKRIFAVRLQTPSPPRIAQHIHDRRINVYIPQRVRLAPGHFAHFANQCAIPRLPQPELRRKIRRLEMFHPADALIREFRRHAQPRVLNEKPLHLIQRPDMLRRRPDVRIARQILFVVRIARDILINIRHAIVPEGIMPVGRRQIIR